MSYKALYRTWRPQKFSELIGQPVITTTLKNAITTDQVSHAYLFAGPRGTGKTSAAKIFAKAVDCPHQKDGEPCNQCSICKAITRGSLGDVIEIDAASNNSVDEIRQVRDKARYAPTVAKYKIYIIDEVHMLSTGAFNALLKTLEEPPKHVIFILATTEPQKIPATIISRVQRYNFKRIKPKDILERMEYILQQEKIKYNVKALAIIAKAAEGGMRDALSILDEALSYSKDNVTYSDALQVTGSVNKSLVNGYMQDVVNHKVKQALIKARQIISNGKDANQFIEQLISYCQNMLFYQQSPEELEKEELDTVGNDFKAIAKSASSDLIYQIIEQLDDIQEQMRYSVHPGVYLEVLTVKIATLKEHHDKSQQEIKSLRSQINELSGKVDRLEQNGVKVRTSQQPRRRANDTQTMHKKQTVPKVTVNTDQINVILSHASREDLEQSRSAWSQIVDSSKPNQKAILGICQPVAASDNGLIATVPYNYLCQRLNKNQQIAGDIGVKLQQIIGNETRVMFIPGFKWITIRHDFYAKYFAKKLAEKN